MQPKRAFLRLLLSLGFLSLVLLHRYQDALKELFSLQLKKIKAYKDNFFAASDPQVMIRQRPISLAKKESELEVYFGEPFASFELKEWDKLWEVVYGIYPKAAPEHPGFPPRMRQLTRDEIIAELKAIFPLPFTYFSKSHWEDFFSIIFEK